MSFTNFQKTIALLGGVLVLSSAIVFIVIAAPWQGPTANPPLNNADAPINVGGGAQTKAGDLTVSELTTSGGKLYLNNSGLEGDIERVDEIIGENDLQLRSDPTSKTEIFLDDGDQGIKFKHQGTDVLVVGDDNAVHIPELTDAPDFDGCFLEIDENGKIKCYTGGIPPGGDLLETSENELLYISWCEFNDNDLSYTFAGGDNKDKVIKIVYSLNAYRQDAFFRFYVDDGTGEVEFIDDTSWGTSPLGTVIKTWYYHIPNMSPSDVTIRVAVWSSLYRSGCCAATSHLQAWVYELNAKRGDVNWASSQGEILYYYYENTTGEMFVPTVSTDYIHVPPVSVIISAKNEEDVKINTD